MEFFAGNDFFQFAFGIVNSNVVKHLAALLIRSVLKRFEPAEIAFYPNKKANSVPVLSGAVKKLINPFKSIG